MCIKYELSNINHKACERDQKQQQLRKANDKIPVKQNCGYDEAGGESEENDCAREKTSLAFQLTEPAVQLLPSLPRPSSASLL